MSLPVDNVARLVLVLPKARLRKWHRQLAVRLSRSYEVDILLDDRAPPYAWCTRLWLALEQRMSGSCSLLEPVPADHSWRLATNGMQGADVLVINLSERPWHQAGALELRYNGSSDSRSLLRCLLGLQSPRLSIGPVGETGALAFSQPAIEIKLSISRALQAVFMRAIAVVERGLQSRTLTDDDGTHALELPARDCRALSAFVIRMVAQRALRLAIKPFVRFDHWHVALRLAAGRFKIVQDDGQRFYADPFLKRWRDRTFLFVEEYPYATGKGVISAAEVIGDRVVADLVPVLTLPYHLSYPFVFEYEDELYMLPETGGNRSLELYRAVEFPWKWELSVVLMKDIVVSDATLLRHQGLWWLFATVSAPDGSTQDELSIFYSGMLHGPWQPHSGNPVKSDCRSSRSAGRIVQENGRLFRPAQDCERTYGAGVVWLEITELTPNSFSERQVARWDAGELRMSGLHSFDQLDQLQAIDFKRSIGRHGTRSLFRSLALYDGDQLDVDFIGVSGANIWNEVIVELSKDRTIRDDSV